MLQTALKLLQDILPYVTRQWDRLMLKIVWKLPKYGSSVVKWQIHDWKVEIPPVSEWTWIFLSGDTILTSDHGTLSVTLKCVLLPQLWWQVPKQAVGDKFPPPYQICLILCRRFGSSNLTYLLPSMWPAQIQVLFRILSPPLGLQHAMQCLKGFLVSL